MKELRYSELVGKDQPGRGNLRRPLAIRHCRSVGMGGLRTVGPPALGPPIQKGRQLRQSIGWDHGSLTPRNITQRPSPAATIRR